MGAFIEKKCRRTVSGEVGDQVISKTVAFDALSKAKVICVVGNSKGKDNVPQLVLRTEYGPGLFMRVTARGEQVPAAAKLKPNDLIDVVGTQAAGSGRSQWGIFVRELYRYGTEPGTKETLIGDPCATPPAEEPPAVHPDAP